MAQQYKRACSASHFRKTNRIITSQPKHHLRYGWDAYYPHANAGGKHKMWAYSSQRK